MNVSEIKAMQKEQKAIEKASKTHKCACGLRTYQRDGVCRICKLYGLPASGGAEGDQGFQQRKPGRAA
jgi:hypothetical protein